MKSEMAGLFPRASDSVGLDEALEFALPTSTRVVMMAVPIQRPHFENCCVIMWCTEMLILTYYVHSFSVASVTSYYILSDLKQHKCILLQLGRSEV